MTNFEQMEQAAYERGILVMQNILDENSEYHGFFLEVHGQPVILINRHKTTAEKTIALMEELAHHETTTGNILDQTKVENRKAEKYARVRMYEGLLPAIQSAIRNGSVFHWEVAEEADIPHETLLEIVEYCDQKGIALNQQRFEEDV